jgi:hypothetical protein
MRALGYEMPAEVAKQASGPVEITHRALQVQL